MLRSSTLEENRCSPKPAGTDIDYDSTAEAVIDSRAKLRKTKISLMSSERQKREEEIERLMRGGLNREADVAFQEKVKKAASAIFEEETTRIQKNEPVERVKRPVNPMTVGLWLVVIGAGLTFTIPGLGGLLILCGLAVMVWAIFLKPGKSNPSRPGKPT